MIENYSFNENIIIRTPLKPLKTAFNEKELKIIFSQKEIQEALFLASPTLLKECEKWLAGNIIEQKSREELIHSLLKYSLRMHSRCTPFGLFASCGILKNDEIESIIISPSSYQRHTRLDMDFTCALIQEIENKEFIQPYLKYYPNNSIYRLSNKLRYVECFNELKKKTYQISEVDNSMYLQMVVNLSKGGITISRLIEALINNGIDSKQAEKFLKEVIKAQILVSELTPNITGNELLEQTISILNKISKNHPNLVLNEMVFLLKTILRDLENIDLKIGNDITKYERIAQRLEKFNVTLNINKLFQSDLFLKPNNYKLKTKNVNTKYCNKDTYSSLKKALTVLNKLSTHHEPLTLKIFKEKFKERYETKEVPLSTVLDNETGIGYGNNNNLTGIKNPLLANLNLVKKTTDQSKILFTKEHSFLLEKLIKAKKNNQLIISIDNSELTSFTENWNNLPESFSIMYSILDRQNDKNLLYIHNIGGSSAINLLGRFGISDKSFEKLIKKIAQSEQCLYKNKIFASILHLPENRTGNILLRPIIRDYEIPYLTKSLLPNEQQILLDDLFISIKDDKIILRSKSLNKEVIPRLDNAHNYSQNSLPIYHFLCDLQTQDIRESLYLDWGPLQKEFSFLPRVEVDNVIVFLATWQLKKEQYKILFTTSNISEWQKKWKLPDLILLVEGDNELIINLKNQLSLSLFISEIRKREQIILKEFLFNENTHFVRDKSGNAYTNELIMTLHKQKNKVTLEKIGGNFSNGSKGTHYPSENNFKFLPRTFSIGSEWLYYKIYCGIKTGDVILTKIIKPLTEQLIREKLIDSWFFIRYSTPSNHLRVRFHLTNIQNIGKIIEKFHEDIDTFHRTGLIWKIQIDTYQREIERYGQSTMVLSEQLFFYDSVCIVSLLTGIKNEEIRWLFAMKAINQLFNEFNLTINEKILLTEKLKINFASEFSIEKKSRKKLNNLYRERKNDIEDLLVSEEFLNEEYQLMIYLLERKKQQQMPIIKEIIKLQEKNQLQVSIPSLLSSYTHMLINRLFKNKQRMHEMVIYEFLWRTYRSMIAKSKVIKDS